MNCCFLGFLDYFNLIWCLLMFTFMKRKFGFLSKEVTFFHTEFWSMTTAARPTWAPAKGGNEQGGTRIFGPSQKYSSRDIAAHTTLKPRQVIWNNVFFLLLLPFQSVCVVFDLPRSVLSLKLGFLWLNLPGSNLHPYSVIVSVDVWSYFAFRWSEVAYAHFF